MSGKNIIKCRHMFTSKYSITIQYTTPSYMQAAASATPCAPPPHAAHWHTAHRAAPTTPTNFNMADGRTRDLLTGTATNTSWAYY